MPFKDPEVAKAYLEANKEKMYARNREYYKKNKDLLREKRFEDKKKWREANKEKRKEQMKSYWEKNREILLEKHRKYHYENKDVLNKRCREWYKQNKDYYTCKTPLCSTVARLEKYKGYCLRCFMFNFPDVPIVYNYKIKEKHFQDFLQNTYPAENLEFDKGTKACSQRRPDCVFERFTHIIIVECDEYQHRDYDTTCEIARINELFTDFADRPIVFIRFNPDEYMDKNGVKQPSCFRTVDRFGVLTISNKDTWNDRLQSLKQSIDYFFETIPLEPITIINLFYDEE